MKNKKGIAKLGVVALIAIGAAIYLNFGADESPKPKTPITIQKPIGKDKKESIKSDFEGGAVRSGYISSMSSKSQLITSYKDFETYCEKYNSYSFDGKGNIIKRTGKLNALVDKYDKKFFEEKSLALVYVELGSGSTVVEFVAASKAGNSVTVMYKKISPEVGTCDMSGYIVYAEVDKDITNIITY